MDNGTSDFSAFPTLQPRTSVDAIYMLLTCKLTESRFVEIQFFEKLILVCRTKFLLGVGAKSRRLQHSVGCPVPTRIDRLCPILNRMLLTLAAPRFPSLAKTQRHRHSSRSLKPAADHAKRLFQFAGSKKNINMIHRQKFPNGKTRFSKRHSL